MALTPQQQQIMNAIDMANSSGDAWSTIGPEGVLAYMQDSLRKRYGTDDLSKIRYIADASVPGGYRLDWEGRQPVTGFLGGIRDASRSMGVTSGAPAGDASDGSPMIAGNPAEDINFGATWEGKGGTTFSFYRKPDGSLGIKTASANTNDKGDIIAAIGTVLGGMALGGALGAGAAGAGAGAGATGAATTAADLGMAGFGQIGVPSAIPAGTGFGSLGATSLAAPASTFGGTAIGSGLAGSLAGLGGIAGAAGAGGAAGAAGVAAGGAGGGGAAVGGVGGAGSASTIGGLVSTLTGGGGWGSLVMPALSLLGGAYTSHQAGEAADAQIAAADRGIAENRRQFDLVRELLSPYVSAGTGALGSYRALSGAAGPDAQRAEIAALEGSPQFGSLVKQGENAILQNASATGGLRGGNVQAGLADYRTNVLSGLIDKQLGRYGGLLQVGQNSAAGVGTAAMNSGQLNSNLMQQQGAAQAGGIVAGTNAFTNALGGVGGFLAGRGTTLPAVSSAQAALSQTPVGSAGFGTGLVYGNQDYGQYF